MEKFFLVLGKRPALFKRTGVLYGLSLGRGEPWVS
jgi:hypothetical protein